MFNRKIFAEVFTVKKERVPYKNIMGYTAYNSEGEKVGVAFPNDDPRTPAYGNLELYFYEPFRNRYGTWHRVTSNGERISWDRLSKFFENNYEYKLYID